MYMVDLQHITVQVRQGYCCPFLLCGKMEVFKMQGKKKNVKIIITVAALIVVAALLFVVWKVTRPETVEGAKNIVVTVDFADGTTKEHKLNTDAEYLADALKEKDLIVGDEGEFGIFVTEVDGVKADDSLRQWWAFYKDGELLPESISTTVIVDGDHFEAVLSTY